MDHRRTSSQVPAPRQKSEFGSRKDSCLVPKNFQDFPSYRMFGHMYGALNIDEKKLITQFDRKLLDKSFEPN
jgi:hypothetical protein